MPKEFQYVHTELSVEKINYWASRARGFLEEYGKGFNEFTQDLELLKRRGNYRLQTTQATGYNILRTSRAMDLQSNDMLLFYSNNITNTQHFGLLLAELEHRKLITEDEITFGVKSSSVLSRPEETEQGKEEEEDTNTELGEEGWTPDIEKVKVRKIKRINKETGEEELLNVEDSLDLVLTIRARNEQHAIDLVDFFDMRTFKRRGAPLPDSWAVPDIRATDNLSNALQRSRAKYRRVVANMSHAGHARLIVLRKSSIIRKNPHTHISVNEDLAKFLLWLDVPE